MADTASIPVRILLIEDSKSDVAIITGWLEESETEKYDIHSTPDIASALAELGKYAFRAIILDLSLPDATGSEGLKAIHNTAPTIPIIILTGHDDEILALSAVENGAQDYLIKSKTDSGIILRSIRYAIHRKRFESHIVRQANFDKLTGLANRILFDSRLSMALGRMARGGQGIGLLFLDLDGFKQINDTYGHFIGDKVLKEISGRIAQCVRPYDTAARLGGDEFAVLIEGITQQRDCVTIALKLIECITAPVTVENQETRVGVSIGIETCNAVNLLSAEDIVNHADEAMYSAKLKKDSAYCFYTKDMEDIQKKRIKIETDLRKAVDNDELILCYQPKQSLATGKACGVEALVRWNHPERGLVMPGEFIGIARDINMLEDIEKWVLTKVCEDIQHWHDIDLPFIHVSVNISSRIFDAPYFLKFMRAMVKDAIGPEQLSLELPESMFLIPDENRMKTFAKLSRMGIGIAMDQFSIQNSSVQSLKAMMLSEIKFGSDFIGGTDDKDGDMRMVKAIIGCAHSLGLQVIACGVESEELRNSLKEERCDSIQGFIFSRPMPAEYLEKWLLGKKDNSPLKVISNKPKFRRKSVIA